MKTTLLSLLTLIIMQSATHLAAVELVRDGKPVAEIVIAEDPLPQVTLAAAELREHIRKISGAELDIVNRPSGTLLPVYVGESSFTRQLGLELDGVENEGYRIVVTNEFVALFGHDEVFPFYPRGFDDASKRPELLKEWQEFAGQEWDFPFLQFYDPRNFNEEFGFSLFDPSGTLFAVYDVLEQLGVRWFMPHHGIGTVIPEKKDVVLALQDEVTEPVFNRRYLRVGWGSDGDTFLWSKRQRLGVSELIWNCHGTSRATRYFDATSHPELFAIMGGDPIPRGGSFLPRLAEPLEEMMASYADAFFRWFPETRHVSVGPADAFTSIDERDVEAGWLKEERGGRGRLSDYVWTFIDGVAEKVAQTHPDKVVMGLAYSYYREPPESFDQLAPNVGVTFCQNRSGFHNPEVRDAILSERKAWNELMQNDEFYVWEYYLWHRGPDHHGTGQLWGVPVIFWNTIVEDARMLRGISQGEYIEAWPLQSRKMWGINHMTMYLQARVYWEPDLDLDAFLNEYYTMFYGPAADEMREFFEFAESVWMRPESRTITQDGGFLRRADVERYFEILGRARAAAGDTVYGERVDLIIEECQPMLTIWQKLQRIGPEFRAPAISARPHVDGDLSKSLWRTAAGEFKPPYYVSRDLNTEVPVDPQTTVMMRWADDDSGLYLAISCAEPEMATLRPAMRINNSISIYDEDFVEIFIERPGRGSFIFVINALGTLLTRASDPLVEPSGLNWNPEIELAVQQHGDRWDIEMFIPRSELDGADVSTADQSWGINVCRTRFLEGGTRTQNSAIAPTHGRFFTPNRFGSLVVDNDS